MSEELNQITGQRLKLLYRETGISQRDLAEMIGRKETALSPIANGKAPLTARTAKLIHDVLPDYSVEYLTGESPYRNDREREIEERAQKKHHGDMLDLGIGALADACGYTFTARATLVPQGEPLESGFQKLVPDTEMIVSRDGNTTVISREDMRRIQQEVCDFLDFKIQQAFKANGERG